MTINPIEPNNPNQVSIDTKNKISSTNPSTLLPSDKVSTNESNTNINTANTNSPDSVQANSGNQVQQSQVPQGTSQTTQAVESSSPQEKLQQTLLNDNLPIEQKIKAIDDMISQKKQELQALENQIATLKNTQNTSNDPVLNNITNISNQSKILSLENQKNTINNEISMLENMKRNLIYLSNQTNNTQNQLENFSSVYDTTINHLKMLKEQLLQYQQTQATYYNNQINSLTTQINQLEKEIQDLLNTHPSNPDEANQIAQQIAQKRALQDILRNQLDGVKQQLFNLNQNVQQQVNDLDTQIKNTIKEKQLNQYQMWALDQSIRREIENIIWGEMIAEKNHILQMWKMYYDYTQKARQMWQDIYTKQLANESSFVAAWTAALVGK